MAGVIMTAKGERGTVSTIIVPDEAERRLSVGDVITAMYQGKLTMGKKPPQVVVSLQCREAT